MNNSKIIVSLDFADVNQARMLAKRLDPKTCRLKVGKELFTCGGPSVIQEFAKSGFDIFLDLKFHDIPNTVAAACKTAADLGVWMLNVHAMGGKRMLCAAREALDSLAQPPLLIAVTVLTSMGKEDLAGIGINLPVRDVVKNLAMMSSAAGVDGVVCSAQEATMLRGDLGQDFILVTPGIRPTGSGTDDQRRTVSPAEAIAAGSDYLVIGRPITRASDPLQALQLIEQEVNQALLSAAVTK